MLTGYEKMLLERFDELLKWTRLMAKPCVRDLINLNLTTEIEYAVYELSDGILSTRDISEKLSKKVSHGTVANYWRKWYKLGIVESSPNYQGRYMKICSLVELGITIPLQISENSSENEKEDQ